MDDWLDDEEDWSTTGLAIQLPHGSPKMVKTVEAIDPGKNEIIEADA
jgi:hypothetical protein